jgi:hypothetical protein
MLQNDFLNPRRSHKKKEEKKHALRREPNFLLRQHYSTANRRCSGI